MGRVFFFFAAAWLAGVSLLSGQIRDPLAPRPVEKPPQNTVMVGLRYLSSPTVSFAGLGTIMSSRDIGEDSAALAGTVDQFYSDGAWRVAEDPQDFGSGPTTPLFSFASFDINANLATNTAQLHRYSAEAAGGAEIEGDGRYGWEFRFRRDFSSGEGSFQWGVLAGFAFTSIEVQADVTMDAAITADVGTFSLPLLFGPAPTGDDSYVGVEGETRTSAQRQGPVTQQNLTGAVFNDIDYEVAMYHFRLGPHARFEIFEGFDLQGSVGAAAIFSASEFAVRKFISDIRGLTDANGVTYPDGVPESYLNSLAGIEVREIDKEGIWVFGAYVDVTAFYELVEGVEIFAGVEYLSADTIDHELEDGEIAEVDLAENLHLRFGMGFSF